jgi:hypothetical protein
MATGTKNVVAINDGISKIEVATTQFKSKRINYSEYFEIVTTALESMTDERDFAKYMQNIGYFDKLQKLD